jgi:hypothetical protein
MGVKGEGMGEPCKLLPPFRNSYIFTARDLEECEKWRERSNEKKGLFKICRNKVYGTEK